jgi:hypothetical protein
MMFDEIWSREIFLEEEAKDNPFTVNLPNGARRAGGHTYRPVLTYLHGIPRRPEITLPDRPKTSMSGVRVPPSDVTKLTRGPSSRTCPVSSAAQHDPIGVTPATSASSALHAPPLCQASQKIWLISPQSSDSIPVLHFHRNLPETSRRL